MRITLMGVLIMGLVLSFGAAAWAQADPEPQDSMAAVVPDAALAEGAINWVEIVTFASELSQDFYSTVFGWQFEPYAPGYDFFLPPAGLMGGLNSDSDDDTPDTMFYICTADLAGKLKEVAAAGGEILTQPEQIGEEGAIATIADPNGVVFGLTDMLMLQDYSPAPYNPAGSTPVNGSLCGFEIYGDGPAAAAFYGKLFGWRLTPASEPGCTFFLPVSGTGGQFQSVDPGMLLLPYIWVEDLQATISAIEANGGVMVGEPSPSPELGTLAWFVDPSGIAFGLVSP